MKILRFLFGLINRYPKSYLGEKKKNLPGPRRLIFGFYGLGILSCFGLLGVGHQAWGQDTFLVPRGVVGRETPFFAGFGGEVDTVELKTGKPVVDIPAAPARPTIMSFTGPSGPTPPRAGATESARSVRM